MPTPALMQIPKSRSEEEFECICTDVLNKKNNDRRFKRYGRNGQGQGGIDIYDESSSRDCVVAQCKNYFNPKSKKTLIKKIKEDIDSLIKLPFYNDIRKFIVMTSVDRDTEVQNEILGVNSNIDIEILFWEDIQEEICKNDDLLQIYYPHIFNNFRVEINARNKIISSIDTLKKIAKYFNSSCNGYKIAENENEDRNLYNICISMYNTSSELDGLKDKYYLQLKEMGIINTIEDILKSLPDIYDASNDWTGTNMIATIHKYLEDFCEGYKYIMYVKMCEKVVKELL